MSDCPIMEVFGGPADGVLFNFFAAYGRPPESGAIVNHRRPRARVNHVYRVNGSADDGWKLVYIGPEAVECNGK